MSNHRYILEPYKGIKTRHLCPNCQHKDKTFSLYIDTQTGEPVNTNVGRCNREIKCAYHYTPKQYFNDNKLSFDSLNKQADINSKSNKSKIIKKQLSLIPIDTFKQSLKGYEINSFVQYLIDLFGAGITVGLIEKYFIGTSKYKFTNKGFPDYISEVGATVFWQIDLQGKVRTGKIMLYSPITGKRVKEPFKHITWVHKAIKQPEYELKQCLFGEHLLKDKLKPVAIVESEKTAIIASVYLPKFIWLAVGSLSYLNAEKSKVLSGRRVVLFPDLKGFDSWSKKAKQLSPITKFVISDLLERKASEAEREQGLDLADYLIRFDYKEFVLTENLIKPDIQILKTANIKQPSTENGKWVLHDTITKTESAEQKQQSAKNIVAEWGDVEHNQVQTDIGWEQEITELELYFSSIILPLQPVKLNSYSTITNVSSFINSHLAIVKANKGKRNALPYFYRLRELQQVLTTKLNRYEA